jgi:hypothetical protein
MMRRLGRGESTAFQGGGEATVADDIYGEALQHEADEGEVSGGLI